MVGEGGREGVFAPHLRQMPATFRRSLRLLRRVVLVLALGALRLLQHKLDVRVQERVRALELCQRPIRAQHTALVASAVARVVGEERERGRQRPAYRFRE